MHRYAAFFVVVLASALRAGPAFALDKVDPYICPTQSQGSGIDCFLEAVPQTYTMCRHIKSIEIIVRPYQAALREAAHSKEEVQSLRQLYDTWLGSLAKLVPAPDETDEAYKQRVVRPYGEFSERIKAIRALAAAPAAPAPKAKKTAPASTRKKTSP
jgi:hypothetical protein